MKSIRNITGNEFTNKLIQEAYYKVDLPFRQWLKSLEVNQDKEERILKWRLTLKKNYSRTSRFFLVQSAGHRDYKGVFGKDKPFKNIATAYNQFAYWLNKNLGFNKN